MGNALFFFAQKKLVKFLAKWENRPINFSNIYREGWKKIKTSGGKKKCINKLKLRIMATNSPISWVGQPTLIMLWLMLD